MAVRPSSGRFMAVSHHKGRVSGDELLTALFEAMHDLHFLRDSLEGGDFCLQLANDMIPSHAGVVHSFDMNTREKTGMLQHLLQRAATSWCWRHLGDHADLHFVNGFATDLVIDILGENNARSGGSGRAKTSEGEGGFIPGAPSKGGMMLMILADSSWRLSLGKEYFTRILRQAQKAGEHAAPESKDKLGHFLVKAPKGTATFRIDAPLLGKVAFEREAIPEQFVDDYLEFHRAYRAAFVHWLEIKNSKTKSPEKFRAFLVRLMQAKEGDTFEAMCQEVFGVPLSSKSPDDDTLERRFLVWLAESSR